jgi:transposase
LLERFVLGVSVYRQRFLSGASLAAVERFYRLAWAGLAYVEHLREPFQGVLECDEPTLGGREARANAALDAAGKINFFR